VLGTGFLRKILSVPPKEEVVFLFKIVSKMIVSVRRLVQKIKVIIKPGLKVQILLPPLLEGLSVGPWAGL
jgi:hypothetical protein